MWNQRMLLIVQVAKKARNKKLKFRKRLDQIHLYTDRDKVRFSKKKKRHVHKTLLFILMVIFLL